MGGQSIFTDRLNEDMRQHADVVRGHDAVHPDRNDCGGVGGCALMRAEVATERDVLAALKTAARQSIKLTVEGA